MAIDFRRTKPSMPQIELTPLIDVIFQLLVFFMISATFTQLSTLPLTLPQLVDEVSVTNQSSCTLSLSTAGEIYLNQSLMSEHDLIIALQEMMAENPDEAIYFEADATVPYEKILHIFKISSAAGVRRFEFVYQPVQNENI